MTRRVILFGALLMVLVACDDHKPVEEAIWLPPLDFPEHPILALEAIYNDKVRSAPERLQAYESLLAPPAGCDTCPSFQFFFNYRDEGGRDVWGRDEEIRAHRGLFQAQDDGKIESLTLDIEFLPAEDLTHPYGPPGWKSIYATRIHLRLLDGSSSGFEVVGGHAEFRIYPAQGRWVIGEWSDLPPLRPSVEVEQATWADIKALFLK
jgi:hypothetical protein